LATHYYQLDADVNYSSWNDPDTSRVRRFVDLGWSGPACSFTRSLIGL